MNILALLNTVLPAVVALYKELREQNPTAPSLSDAELFDLLEGDSASIVAKANAWLAAHSAFNPTPPTA